MTDAAIQVDGLRPLVRNLARLGPEYVTEVKAINVETARAVVPIARGLAPQRTGALAGSIRAGATRLSGVVKAGNRRVPYAAPIHWGWPRRHISGQPFLVDALARVERRVVDEYARRLQAVADRALG